MKSQFDEMTRGLAQSVARRAPLANFRFGLALALLCLGLAPTRLLADPLDHWVSRTSGTSNGLTSIAYVNNQFVTVGSAGTILTSPYGSTWTTRAPDTNVNLYSVAYGNNLFVAGANGGNGSSPMILTSPDGTTWRTSTLGANLVRGLAFGNGQFVFVTGRYGHSDGVGGPIYFASYAIYTSPNGTNWTLRTSGSGGILLGITYGNNQFAAVGTQGLIVTSTDGSNWTRQISGTTNDLRGITYGNNEYVAVGAHGQVLTSPDGVTWTGNIAGSGDFSGIAYGNNTFVAAGTAIFSSPDGMTWTQRASQGGNAIAYGNKSFAVVGAGGTILQFSLPPELGPVKLLSSGAAQVTMTAPAGQTYAIQASTNLNDWLTITNVALANVSGQFADPAARNFSKRFYRVVNN